MCLLSAQDQLRHCICNAGDTVLLLTLDEELVQYIQVQVTAAIFGRLFGIFYNMCHGAMPQAPAKRRHR
jgi:hypothetical protein